MERCVTDSLAAGIIHPSSSPLGAGSFFVSHVIHWAHTAKFTCHLGINGTRNLPQRRLWWPSLMKDVPEYLSACIICAFNKSSRFPLADNSDHFPPQAVLGPTLPLTSPLVFPNLPITWSSSSPFFEVQVTLWPCPSTRSLAPDRPCFPAPGIPLDIVSNQGPQLISGVWWDFYSILGAKINLTSGFHPQTNGKMEQTNRELEAALCCHLFQPNYLEHSACLDRVCT